MRKTDINNYSGDRGGSSVSVGSVIKEFFTVRGIISELIFYFLEVGIYGLF